MAVNYRLAVRKIAVSHSGKFRSDLSESSGNASAGFKRISLC